MFRNRIRFYGEELLAPHPTPKLQDHPLSAVCGWLFNIYRSYPPYWRPFLHPQPEDAPCYGDRDSGFGGETWGKETTWETQA